MRAACETPKYYSAAASVSIQACERHRSNGWRLAILFGWLLLASAIRSGHAQQIEQTTMIIKATTTVNAAGNARLDATINFNPPRIYDRIKRAYPNLYVLFRDLIASDRANTEIDRSTLHITSDDGSQTIAFKTDALGVAVCKDNTWRIQLAKGETLVTQEGSKVITSLVSSPSVGLIMNGTGVYALPATAHNVKIDTDNHLLTYTLPGQGGAHAKAAGSPQMNLTVRYQPNVMSSVYKVYADPEVANGRYWVAKSIVKNTGSAPMYDLKVSYTLGEFADEGTPEPYTVVPPGGAVVDCYYPLFSSKVAQLKTRTPAHLHIRCEYKDAAGKVYTDEKTELLSILGINQFQFSNLTDAERTDSWFDTNDNYPLLAAYVTKVDDPVKQFAGYVSEVSGGAGAAIDVKSAVKWLEAAYDMELANNIVYQTPSSNSYSQDIKYPRDVFRAKSGTCIDLAILYSSLAESVGLHSYLMLVPGHCFSVIRLPDGQLLPVENTGLGGGDQRMNFEQAVKVAVKEFSDYQQQGLFHFIDVQAEQDQGHIPSPELPALDINFLDTCGIKRLQGLIPPTGRAPENGGQPDGSARPDIAAPPASQTVEDPKGFSGIWKGKMGKVDLTITMDQDNDQADGSLQTEGTINVKGDFKKAAIRENKTIKLHVRAVGDQGKLSIDLNGRRDGGIIKGTGTVVVRGQLDVPLQTINVVWWVQYSGK